MSDSKDAVLIEKLGEHIALVTLNRPDKQNAINGEIARGLEAATEAIEADDNLRVAVLAAAGNKAFCAGADLAAIAAGARDLSTRNGGFAGFVRAHRTKPWIAAIHGTAVGGGCELALACDMAVMADSAKIGLPEVKRGVLAAAGGAFRIGQILPRPIAIEMLLTGEPIGADRALHFGLVNRVVPAQEVVTEALALAESIAANAPLSVRESLTLVKLVQDCTEAELWERNTLSTKRVVGSEDAKEGPRAFLEKRQPQWKGR